MNETELPAPLFVIVEAPAVLLPLKNVCVLSPLLLIAAMAALEVPKNAVTELGKAAEALLLMTEFPALELSRKFTRPVALLLLIVAPTALEVLKKFVVA